MNDVEMAYQATLEYLYTFVDYSLVRNFRNSPETFDLGRMRRLAEALGNPQDQYPVIHVAGTKGKGSVAALCASALRAAGYRVGLYTSPHLDDFAERIQFDGQPIPHAELVSLVDEQRLTFQSIPRLTFFEITTALAFLYFARQKATAGVIEVGLGGRLDATNICRPRLAVITSLSYDHMALLGETLAEIAGEKAGIIKEGVPVVVAPQKEEARQVVERVAQERGSALIQVGRDYQFAALSHSLGGQSLQVWPASAMAMGTSAKSIELEIPLLGLHQVENAATAYATLQVASQQGMSITEEQIREGFRHTSWPGRFEVLRYDPPVVVDCAHNRDSAAKLCKAVDDYFPGMPVVLVFGASEDKDILGMLEELLPRVRQVILVKSYHPRSADPEKLALLVQQAGKPVRIIPEVTEALDEALRQGGSEGGKSSPGGESSPVLVLVTGSIFVASGARIAWMKAMAVGYNEVQ
jgi:dihydrofolate synthase/folylpolyglutamate synthase